MKLSVIDYEGLSLRTVEVYRLVDLFFKQEGGYQKAYPGIELIISLHKKSFQTNYMIVGGDFKSDYVSNKRYINIYKIEHYYTELLPEQLNLEFTLYHELQHLCQFENQNLAIYSTLYYRWIEKALGWYANKRGFELNAYRPIMIYFNNEKVLTAIWDQGKLSKSFSSDSFLEVARRKWKSYKLFPWELEADMMAFSMVEARKQYDLSILSNKAMGKDKGSS